MCDVLAVVTDHELRGGGRGFFSSVGAGFAVRINAGPRFVARQSFRPARILVPPGFGRAHLADARRHAACSPVSHNTLMSAASRRCAERSSRAHPP